MNRKRYDLPRVCPALCGRTTLLMAGVAALALVWTAVPSGRADLVVSDDFSYADGSVGGGEENGGIGWAGAWGASSSVNTPPNEYTIQGGQAIFTGNGANQEVITHDRALSDALTVGTLDTMTIGLDLIIGPSDGQIGRGVGVNFIDGGDVVFTLAKRINGEIGVWDSGIGTASVQLSDGVIPRVAGTTFNLTATLTYDGADTLISLTDGGSTVSATLAGTQVTIDTVQLTGYHQATTGNGIDNLLIDVVTIPEPATALLLGIGGLALYARRRR